MGLDLCGSVGAFPSSVLRREMGCQEAKGPALASQGKALGCPGLLESPYGPSAPTKVGEPSGFPPLAMAA